MSLALGRGNRPHRKRQHKTAYLFKQYKNRKHVYRVLFWDNDKGWWTYKGTQTLPGETRKTLTLKFEEQL